MDNISHFTASYYSKNGGISEKIRDDKMNDDVLVKVEGVSKKFCRSLKRSLFYGLQDIGTEILGGSNEQNEPREGEFWAIKDVSFELKRGECLGLIGRNGAGKTTLLKMLNGLIKPDTGIISMRGRVGALIALGAGFNPILTGRENIYVNGSVIGLTKKEIDIKIDDIINFAEIRESIDSPVQSYSSGMQVRLGFSVASALAPDVLLIDEVLAVGDRQFRIKCINRINEMRKKCAIILVSHTPEDIIRICDKAILLEKGIISDYDTATSTLAKYESIDTNNDEFVKCDEGYKLVTSRQILKINYGETLNIECKIEIPEEGFDYIYRFVIFSNTGELVAEWRSDFQCGNEKMHSGENIIHTKITNVLLRPGSYYIDFALSRGNISHYAIVRHRFINLVIKGNNIGFAKYQMR